MAWEPPHLQQLPCLDSIEHAANSQCPLCLDSVEEIVEPFIVMTSCGHWVCAGETCGLRRQSVLNPVERRREEVPRSRVHSAAPSSNRQSSTLAAPTGGLSDSLSASRRREALRPARLPGAQEEGPRRRRWRGGRLLRAGPSSAAAAEAYAHISAVRGLDGADKPTAEAQLAFSGEGARRRDGGPQLTPGPVTKSIGRTPMGKTIPRMWKIIPKYTTIPLRSL